MIKNSEKYEVLLVEDDTAMGEAIASSLECFEFKVVHVTTGTAGLEALAQFTPSLILLDLNLPDLPGYEVCKKLRASPHGSTAIIALSGCQDDAEIIKMLESGADDFVGKRSSVAILVAHMRSVLQRITRHPIIHASSSDRLTWGPLCFDKATWKVTVHGTVLDMTPTEARLLERFLESPGAVFTRDQLIAHLHGAGYAVTPRTIDVHINGLRNSLGDLRESLETVRGVGYRFAQTPPPLPRTLHTA